MDYTASKSCRELIILQVQKAVQQNKCKNGSTNALHSVTVKVNANAKVERVELQQSLDSISVMYITVLYL